MQLCLILSATSCLDSDVTNCPRWAIQGECDTNPWMKDNCKKSCGVCGKYGNYCPPLILLSFSFINALKYLSLPSQRPPPSLPRVSVVSLNTCSNIKNTWAVFDFISSTHLVENTTLPGVLLRKLGVMLMMNIDSNVSFPWTMNKSKVFGYVNHVIKIKLS